MLPELGDVAITGTNSDPVKTGSRPSSPSVMPTLELLNGEMANESFFSGINQTRISVNGLIASWTHVSLLYINQLELVH